MEKKIFNFEVKKTRYYFPDEVRFIEFDSGDVDLPLRLVDTRKEIIEYSENLSKKYNVSGINDISKISTGNIDEDIKILRDADSFIKDRINHILDDENASQVAFGNASCISVTKNGEYYFENFLNALVDVVNAEFDTRIEKIKTRIKKYTDKKGSHPALKK